MSIRSVKARHTAILLLVARMPSRALLAPLARKAGIEPPTPMGVEPLFAYTARWLVSAERADRFAALADAAGPGLGDELRSLLVEAEPEPDDWEVEDGAAPADEGPPRPVGTPTTAAPVEGARTWLVRGVELTTPASVGPGELLRLVVRLHDPVGVTSAAPKDYQPYDGLPVDAEIEAWLEEAFPARGADLHRRMRVDPSRPTECSFELLAANPLPEGVGIGVRFFFAGYEVGRARCRIPPGDGTGDAVVSRGVLVIPDSILGMGEDAVKTVAAD
jgi:hypothetical protein